jgi:hypothetical protein
MISFAAGEIAATAKNKHSLRGAKGGADQRITLHVSVCYFAQQRRTRDGRGDGTLT